MYHVLLFPIRARPMRALIGSTRFIACLPQTDPAYYHSDQQMLMRKGGRI